MEVSLKNAKFFSIEAGKILCEDYAKYKKNILKEKKIKFLN